MASIHPYAINLKHRDTQPPFINAGSILQIEPDVETFRSNQNDCSGKNNLG